MCSDEIGSGRQLILESAATVGEGRWVFTLEVQGLTPALAGDSVEFADPGGTVVAELPPIRATDAAGATTGGDYALDYRDGVWRLTVGVDPVWLNAAERRYPVVIDPTCPFGTRYEVTPAVSTLSGIPERYSGRR